MPTLLLMYGNASPSEPHLGRLRAMADGVEVLVAASEREAVAAAPAADAILGHRYLRQSLPHADRLRWVQSTAGGVDHLVGPELVRRKPLLTRCPIFADVIARHAFALSLALTRRIPEAVLAQAEGRWADPFEMLPWPTHATILGLGTIGLELAALLRANGMAVTGVTRDGSDPTGACHRMRSVDDWRDLLPETDALFVAIPGTPANRHFVDRAALRALPRHALVINVARGTVLDTEALLELLRDDRLGGAGLDVVDGLPRPADDPLWRTPRLLITPKVSTFTPDRQARLEGFMEDQVRRFLAGEEPAHRVSIEAYLPLSAVDA